MKAATQTCAECQRTFEPRPFRSGHPTDTDLFGHLCSRCKRRALLSVVLPADLLSPSGSGEAPGSAKAGEEEGT